MILNKNHGVVPHSSADWVSISASGTGAPSFDVFCPPWKPQRKWNPVTLDMECWNVGSLEAWNPVTFNQPWNLKPLESGEPWNPGALWLMITRMWENDLSLVEHWWFCFSLWGGSTSTRQVKTGQCLTFLGPTGTHPQGRGQLEIKFAWDQVTNCEKAGLHGW